MFSGRKNIFSVMSVICFENYYSDAFYFTGNETNFMYHDNYSSYVCIEFHLFI
jgi:hypothetical protein